MIIAKNRRGETFFGPSTGKTVAGKLVQIYTSRPEPNILLSKKAILAPVLIKAIEYEGKRR
jgi:hypothetical protein